MPIAVFSQKIDRIQRKFFLRDKEVKPPMFILSYLFKKE
jgi:hypothetical protein